MPDLWDYRQRWRRRWQRWRRHLDDRREAWRRRRRQTGNSHDSEGRMSVDVQQEAEVAMARVIRQQMDERTLRAVKAAVREEVLPELHEEALALARQELADELAREQERLRDAAAKHKQTLDGELEDELEARTEQLRQEIRADFEERLLVLRDARNEAQAAHAQALALLVGLVTQLLGPRKRYLADAHIAELDLVGLNEVLGPEGIRVRSQYRYSARQVTCKLANGVGQRTVFWLDTPILPDVVEEAAEVVDAVPTV